MFRLSYDPGVPYDDHRAHPLGFQSKADLLLLGSLWLAAKFYVQPMSDTKRNQVMMSLTSLEQLRLT